MPRARKNVRIGEALLEFLEEEVARGVALDVDSLVHSLVFRYKTERTGGTNPPNFLPDGTLRNETEPNGTLTVPKQPQRNTKEQNGTNQNRTEPNERRDVPNPSPEGTKRNFNAAERLRAAMTE